MQEDAAPNAVAGQNNESETCADLYLLMGMKADCMASSCQDGPAIQNIPGSTDALQCLDLEVRGRRRALYYMASRPSEKGTICQSGTKR